MQKQVDKTLLQSYFRGDCNKEQLTIICHYLNNPEYETSLGEFLHADWIKIFREDEQPSVNVKESYMQFLSLVEQTNNGAVERKRKNTVYRLFQSSWKVAVAAILVISLAGFAWWSNDNRAKEYSQWVSIRNKAGQKTFFYLYDSSKVYLGAASSLEYNKGYGITNRELRLNGEAYFIVNHKGKYPFRVTTGQITTVDIGTEFNIRFFKNSPVIEVAVAKGSVEVLNNKQKLATMVESQTLCFDTATQQAKTGYLADNAIGAWRKGVLAFDRQPLNEVVKELERYYGLSVEFANPDQGNIFITTTLKNATATEALEIIALTAGVKIKQEGKHVLIE